VSEERRTLAGHDAEKPSQVASNAHWPAAERQTYDDDEPVQYSVTSQTSTALRQTVLDDSYGFDGHVRDEPLQ
jgi:hypothetical protein